MIALLINVFETNLSNLLEWRINYIIDISNLLVVFNSSFNIIIYYNFSVSFRKIFQKEFCGKKSKFFKKPLLLDANDDLYKNIGNSLTGNKTSLGNGTATTTISASTSENDAGSNCEFKTFGITESTRNPVTHSTTIKFNKCSKCAYSVLFDSNNPPSYRNSVAINKKEYIKIGALPNILRVSNECNSFIEDYTNPVTYKVKNTLEFPVSSLCNIPKKNCTSLNTNLLLNQSLNIESPHSIIKFQDYEEDIQDYMDSCSEIINSPLESMKCLPLSSSSYVRKPKNCANCFDTISISASSTNPTQSAILSHCFT